MWQLSDPLLLHIPLRNAAALGCSRTCQSASLLVGQLASQALIWGTWLFLAATTHAMGVARHLLHQQHLLLSPVEIRARQDPHTQTPHKLQTKHHTWSCVCAGCNLEVGLMTASCVRCLRQWNMLIRALHKAEKTETASETEAAVTWQTVADLAGSCSLFYVIGN